VLGYLLDRQFSSVNEKLEARGHEVKELRDRVDEIWQRTLDIDHHTKQWNKQPRCELEQKLWLKEIGFTGTVQAIVNGHAPTQEQLDCVDKALGIDRKPK
jgi:hypothetical protein